MAERSNSAHRLRQHPWRQSLSRSELSDAENGAINGALFSPERARPFVHGKQKTNGILR